MRTLTAYFLVLLVAIPMPGAAQTPPPSNGSIIDIVDVVVPTQTVGQRAFNATVTLENHGTEDLNVTLFAALYAPRAAGITCGDRTSERFKAFTHLLQPIVTVPAGKRVTYPEAPDRWPQLYLPSDSEGKPAKQEWCVFVAEGTRDDNLNYYDLATLDLNTRPENRPPTGDFSYSPNHPMATQDIVFIATGSDPDGDNLTYSWDFGHSNASGRAKATGIDARHFFYPEGMYSVTLTISDGFEAKTVTRDVAVQPEDTETPTAPAVVTPTQADEKSSIPVPFGITLGAVALALLARRRRS